MRLWKKLLLSTLAVISVAIATGYFLAQSLNTPFTKESMAKNEASPQFKDGRFVNVEPQAPMEISVRRVAEIFEADERTNPTGKIPVVPIQPQRLTTPPAAGLRMAWIGHASVLVEIGGKRILTDPVFSERASPFLSFGPKRFHPTPISLDKLQGIDAVVISHNHYDHLDEVTVRHLAKQGTRFFVPLGNREQLIAWDVPSDQVTELDWWQSATLGELKIVATPSRHYSNRSIADYKQALWASWTILGPDHRIFVSGDTGYSKVFSQIGEKFGPFDATIIKIGAYGPGQSWRDVHMDPQQALKVHQDVRGKIMLPVHWGTYNLAYHAWDEPIIRSVAAAREAKITLATPRPGRFFETNGDVPNENWWKNVN